jgi:hypothetical protein
VDFGIEQRDFAPGTQEQVDVLKVRRLLIRQENAIKRYMPRGAFEERSESFWILLDSRDVVGCS